MASRNFIPTAKKDSRISSDNPESLTSLYIPSNTPLRNSGNNVTYIWSDTTVPRPVTLNNQGYDTNSGHRWRGVNNDPSSFDYMDITLSTAINKMNSTLAIPNNDDTVLKAFRQTTQYYNRFKIPNPDLFGTRYFPHLFFVKPSCYIFDGNGNLRPSIKNDQAFIYASKNAPNVLREISSTNGNSSYTDFMMSLSNAAISFPTSDEAINNGEYSANYTGYKVLYGKSDIMSKTDGSIEVSFNETRNFDIYLLHRLWVEYISNSYRGFFEPSSSTIFSKTLDYAGALYYIVTAENGEDIVYWTKYYGIFPISIPSTQFSWSDGRPLTISDVKKIDISYKFSFKEDFNPYSLIEFNQNAHAENYSSGNYLDIYNKNFTHATDPWATKPFIEVVQDSSNNDVPYRFKLRFKYEGR